jgi:hypothetical protein
MSTTRFLRWEKGKMSLILHAAASFLALFLQGVVLS